MRIGGKYAFDYTLLILAVLTIVLALIAGCSYTLTYARARKIGCDEACAALAEKRHRVSAEGWDAGGAECGCRLDDGTIEFTCRRPNWSVDLAKCEPTVLP